MGPVQTENFSKCMRLLVLGPTKELPILLSTDMTTTAERSLHSYKDAFSEEYQDSIERAMHQELGMYEIDDSQQGINITTDARHGWRRNYKDTHVGGIGERSHAVIQHVHVMNDDHVSQHHETLGTEMLYQNLDKQNVCVAVHTHDRNMASNKYIRDLQKLTTGQKDTWHSAKALKKAVALIGSGAK